MKMGTTPVKGFFYTFSSFLSLVTIQSSGNDSCSPVGMTEACSVEQGALWNKGTKAMPAYWGQPQKPYTSGEPNIQKKDKCETGVWGCGFQRREERTLGSGSKKVCLQKHFISIIPRGGLGKLTCLFGGSRYLMSSCTGQAYFSAPCSHQLSASLSNRVTTSSLGLQPGGFMRIERTQKVKENNFIYLSIYLSSIFFIFLFITQK